MEVAAHKTKPVTVGVFLGDALARYHFGEHHPFGPSRYPAFVDEFRRRGLLAQVLLPEFTEAARSCIEYFHTPQYVASVLAQSASGLGFLDHGDTPAFHGIYHAAAAVVGATLAAVRGVMDGCFTRAFIPVAGLHHAARDRASGFCVFNDCAVAIAALRREYAVQRIAYVDVDAHHGDGVYYGFADDPALSIVDIHEDGGTLFPGTGAADETGVGAATGSKLNIPLPAGSGDASVRAVWTRAEEFLRDSRPEFILLQCGADGLADDPLTHLRYTPALHRYISQRLCAVADACCAGRLVAMGGGGYHTGNLAAAWCEVVGAMLASARDGAS